MITTTEQVWRASTDAERRELYHRTCDVADMMCPERPIARVSMCDWQQMDDEARFYALNGAEIDFANRKARVAALLDAALRAPALKSGVAA